MKYKIEIIKIPRTDKEVDNTAYYQKIPRLPIVDDFGNKAEGLFDKVEINISELQKKVEEGKKAESILKAIDLIK